MESRLGNALNNVENHRDLIVEQSKSNSSSKNDGFEFKHEEVTSNDINSTAKNINQLIEIIDDLNEANLNLNQNEGFDLKKEKAKLKSSIDGDCILPESNLNTEIKSNKNKIDKEIISNDKSSSNSQQSLCSSGSTSTTSMNSNSNRDSLNSNSSFNHVYNINDVGSIKQETDLVNEIDFNKLKLSNQNQIIINSNENNTENNICCNLPENEQFILINHQENDLEDQEQIEILRKSLKDQSVEADEIENDEKYDEFDVLNAPKLATSGSLKRTQLINFIFDLYDMNNMNNENNNQNNDQNNEVKQPTILIEGFMEKLPPGKNLKNSLLLAWRKRYFKLSSIGNLYEYDIDEKSQHLIPRAEPCECYCLMGGRVEYDQTKVISLDDSRGNCLVIRCCQTSKSGACLQDNMDDLFSKWRLAVDSQVIDRSDLLWVKPNHPLTDMSNLTMASKKSFDSLNKKVLIVDIGTCSVRAGLFNNKPTLPKLFIPTVCARDLNNNRYKVGFDAFDFLMSSSAPSTIDLHKSMSSWSLNSTSCPLIFPFKTRGAIDKLNFDIDSIEGILEYVVENLNVNCEDYQIVIITTHKLTDKTNIQFLNMLLTGTKFNFKSATIINQTLLTLYAYNSNVGVVANLGEKIDIVPICNGVSFQSGVTNLAYGGTTMSEYLNSFISRGHVNYVNDMEQYYVRYIKEKSCYAALNYQEELKNYQSDAVKFTLDLNGHSNELKQVEFPESARFKSVEGLFNPEIWGIDGQGIHKLIFKAIQSTSMDLRREMARSIYLCGGMSRIPGLKDRLEKELKQLFPPNLKVKVNCSDYSYHCAYLGAFRFIQQPEYEKLLISSKEWATENVNCLRKWRMM